MGFEQSALAEITQQPITTIGLRSEPFAVEVSIQKCEYIQLKWEASYWKTQHDRALVREEALKKEVEKLQGENRDLRQQFFGRKSEKSAGDSERGDGQPIEQTPTRPRGQQRGAQGHGRTGLSHLPVEEEVVGLPDDKRCCTHCGLPYEPLPGTKSTEVIELDVRAYRRRVHRLRYRRGCQCDGAPRIVSAPPPKRLIARGKLGISVWVQVLLDKFLYCRPTHRLLAELKSYGLPLSQGTVTGGLKALAPLFKPLYAAIRQQQLSELKDSPCHADETRWQVFILIEGKSGYRQYLWVFRTPSVTYYVLDPTRSASVPIAHFKTVEDRIIIVCDRYSAYKCLASQNETDILLAFCWAHVRRDFLKIVKSWPELSGWGIAWVEHIGCLYHLNHRRLAVLDQPALFAECDRQLRTQVEAMARHRDEQLADPSLPMTAKKTLKSLQAHWQGLTLFVDYPLVPMDNNAGEQALRTPVVGRKNYYGSGSLWSGELAAMLFTVLMTMTQWGLNPRLWLTTYLMACAANGNQPPEDLTPYLPWAMNERCLASLRGVADTS